jgi:hypothetical protein
MNDSFISLSRVLNEDSDVEGLTQGQTELHYIRSQNWHVSPLVVLISCCLPGV